MELGIVAFGDRGRDPRTGQRVTEQQRITQLLEEIRLADEVGLDVFGVGEHHREDYVVSSPTTVLAAAAAQTKRIRLSSAVTVLSSTDPVRLFEEFATIDLISGGRVELMAGRGSFIESFPLFGFDTADYDELYAEKLDLLLQLRASERITWQGKHRAPLNNALVRPRPVQDPLPVWVASGGNPESIARAGMLGLPVTIAIIGGLPERMAPLGDLHRRAAEHGGHDPATVPFAVNAHAFINEDAQAAADKFWPAYADAMTRIGRERGWPPARREQFDAGITPRGHLVVGNPEQVAEKIVAQHALFSNDRYLLQFDVGGPAHADVLRSIELFGTQVAPLVHEALAQSPGGMQGVRTTSNRDRENGLGGPAAD